MTNDNQPSQTPPAVQQIEHHYQHDPDQTMLERLLNQWLQKIEPYSNQILMGFIAVTVIAVGAIMWSRSSQAASSVGWQEFITCSAPDEFAELADAHPNLPVGAWARLQQARGHLQDGLRESLTNRKVSDENLQDAKKAFEDLLKNRNSVPAEVREEALYGMATTLEALSDGNNDPAIKAYEELLSAFPESLHRKWVEHRIETLKTGASKEFYAWFRKQNPSPADRPNPLNFETSTGDPFGTAGDSTLRLPLGLDAKPKVEEAKPADATAEPKTEEAKPDEAKPETSAPEAPQTEAAKTEEAKPAAPQPEDPNAEEAPPAEANTEEGK